MPYYHVFIETKSSTREELDLSSEELNAIIECYHNNEIFLCDGSFVNPSQINRIKIMETDESSAEMDADSRDSFDIGEYGKNVTRRFIKHPPVSKKVPEIKKKTPKKHLSGDVFIIHGRDHKLMKELKAMLKEFGLNPIVLHEQPSGSRTIVEKLEKYSDVGYAFAVLTPDDVGCLNKIYLHTYKVSEHEKGDSDKERKEKMENFFRQMTGTLKNRARQNVILEFGYFIGKLDRDGVSGRDRVCCLLKGNVERPSDMHGIVYIPFKESVNEVRDKIVKELKAAGYEIKN